MNKTNKTLIIIVVLLVAVLGIISGFILNGYMSNSNVIIANQTHVSANNSVPIQTNKGSSKQTVSNNSAFITSQKAISIAKPLIGSATGIKYFSQLITNGPVAYYLVDAEVGSNDHVWTDVPTCVDVNAKTGQIITTFQKGTPNPLGST